MQKRPRKMSPEINPTSSLQSLAIKYSLQSSLRYAETSRFLLLVLFNSGLILLQKLGSPSSLRAIIDRVAISFLMFLFYVNTAFAHEQQKLPRFAIVKSNQVNARSGPGTTYPIEWIFVSKGEPIKVVAEFDQWRKVEDIEGKGGWVHSSVLSPKRSVVIIGNNIQKLMVQNDAKSRIVAKLEPGLRCVFDRCKNNWCKIKCDGYKGWIEAVNIWGVIKGEE